MELFTPEVGLLFWMLIPFLVVFFILAKFGFPVIVKMVEDRKAYIDESLVAAKQSYEQLAAIKAQGEAILDEARRDQATILKEATQTRDLLIKEAKDKALIEASRIIDDARKQIIAEKDDAIRDIRSQVAVLSVDIAEKVIRGQIDKKEEQMKIINRLLDEINISKS
jgi:F-type H+-transporting ATPase subunit b